MEKSNFTFSGTIKLLSSLCLLMLFGLNQNLYAQCSLGVNTNTQISLNADCEATITPELVLNDQQTTCPDGIFSVNVQTLDHVNIPTSPIVTSDYVNQTLIAEVVDANSGNTGWGFINIEDKLAPTITCVDVTVSCFNISSFEPTVVDACDPNPTVTLLSQSETVLDCDPDFIKTITRTYQATDADGNQSAPCTQVITVERIDFDDIVFPLDRTQANNNALDCDGTYPKNDDGTPDPLFSGVPTLNGVAIFPTTDLSCNTIVSYNDVVLPSIGGVQKIMREFTVNEWFCNGSNTISDIQIIEVVDDEGPDFATCPTSYSVSTTAGTDCEAIVLLTAPATSDNCGTVHRVDLNAPGTFISNFTSGLVSLPIGVNTITFTAYDNNNNANTCTFDITVEDQTAPVVVCDQFTVVSLSLDGTSLVYAESFDDGSYDDCSDVEYSVRRMDNGANCASADALFGPTESFCCADIGTNVIVVLRVTDAQGNFNDCMVNVEVQDKLAPAITCPANITVECDTPFDPENLGLTFGGSAVAADNCSVDVVELTPNININSCGEGTIIRTFRATDPNGSAQCSQFITFVNSDPFDVNDITYPADITINDCVDLNTLTPEALGSFPILNEDECDMVGFDYDDKVFTLINSDDACFKIIRTWEVLDWCNSTGGGGFTTFPPYQQVIKVTNTVDPIITGDYPNLQECTFDNDCDAGFITLGAAGTDACAMELVFNYNIDLDNDGDFDIISNSTVGTSIDASGNYPIGNHRIVYTAKDGCGNSVSQTQLFSIVNCKLPTPYCYNGLAIELMPIDTDNDGEADFGQVATWASDFDAGSFHACDLPVTVSFSANPLDTGRVFTCADLGDNVVEIWAHTVLPNGDILSDFCTATLDIQGNNGICDGTTTGMLVVIDGDIETEMSEKSSNVNLSLSGSELTTVTNEFGQYAFPAMITGGAYELIPTKNEEDKWNGITTLDIVLIQKHILGLQLLDSPYKMIAADVTNDYVINGSDIINLRKLLLGHFAELPNNQDWRFVDAGYTFINPDNPLSEDYNQTYVINELNSDMNIDFVSIKIGDLNYSASPNATSNKSETRSLSTLNLISNNKTFESGDKVVMDFTAADIEAIHGMQMTVQYNNIALEYAGINGGALAANEGANVGLGLIDQGLLTISLSEGSAVRLDEGDVLFSLVFDAKSEGQLSGNVSINSEITSVEAYNEALEIMDVEVEFRNDNGNEVVTSPFALYQNVPNPFDTRTNISFNLPNTNVVKFSIFDISGKLIYTESKTYAKGMNTIELDVNSFNSSGVLYYQVETKEHTATRKMVVLK